MDNRLISLFGSGRYISGCNVLETLGEECSRFGKNVFIVGGEKALQAALPRIESSLNEHRLTFKVNTFRGYPTIKQVNNLIEAASSSDLILAIGGGKCIDTAKASADTLCIPIITVPTSIATCAAFSPLCVFYDDTGSPTGGLYTRHECAAVAVDYDIIMNSPKRLTIAGITDAMAKEPEISFGLNSYNEDPSDSDMLLSTSHILAVNNNKLLKEQSLAALASIDGKYKCKALENVIYINIALTGIVSGLANGSKQLALAHLFHDAVCHHFKEQRRAYLHGEMVSVGIHLQMIFNNYSDEKILETQEFVRSIGAPFVLRDIGIPPTSDNLDIIYHYLIESELFKGNMQQFTGKLREALERIG